MEPFKIIDYDRSRGGHVCNAVLSDRGGGAEASWTHGRHDAVVAEARPLTGEAFGRLWDGIAASVRDGGAFGRHLVADPTRPVVPAAHHVISTVHAQGGRVRHRTFMVPVGEADPAFAAWLEALGVPARATSLRSGHARPAVKPPGPGRRKPRLTPAPPTPQPGA